MLASVFASGTETTVPTTVPPTTAPVQPTTPPATTPTPVDAGGTGDGSTGSSGDGEGTLAEQVPTENLSNADNVVGEVWDNLSNNGYQTGFALIVATIAVIIMRNLKVKNYILVPVTAGAFWAGWLLWNTVTGQENPLFPGGVSAVKIWDVAIANEWGFFFAAAAGCVAAIALWRSSQNNVVRLVLIAGVFFGASLVYNLFDSFTDDPLLEDDASGRPAAGEASDQQLMSP